jgi:hypothetical protein
MRARCSTQLAGWPLQLIGLPGQDRLDDVGCQQRQPQDLADYDFPFPSSSAIAVTEV